MAYTREQYIEKIKGLLAIANDKRTFENEAIAAAAMAQKLMAKYNIEAVDIKDEDDNEIVEMRVDAGKGDKWKFMLATIIASNFCCKVASMGHQFIIFYGYKQHAEVAKNVYEFLFKLGNKFADRVYADYYKQGKETKGVKNTYLIGYCEGIKSVLEKQCTALALVIPTEVKEHFKAVVAGGKTVKTSLTNNHDAAAYQRGIRDGKDAINSRAIEG